MSASSSESQVDSPTFVCASDTHKENPPEWASSSNPNDLPTSDEFKVIDSALRRRFLAETVDVINRMILERYAELKNGEAFGLRTITLRRVYSALIPDLTQVYCSSRLKFSMASKPSSDTSLYYSDITILLF